MAPKDYIKGAKVEVLVNALSSPDTVLPYDYYYQQFHFCQPEHVQSQSESLGSILMGDRLYNSPFEVCFFSLKLIDRN
jgi:transmembrane 9 superfamily protein 2/4